MSCCDDEPMDDIVQYKRGGATVCYLQTGTVYGDILWIPEQYADLVQGLIDLGKLTDAKTKIYADRLKDVRARINKETRFDV